MVIFNFNIFLVWLLKKLWNILQQKIFCIGCYSFHIEDSFGIETENVIAMICNLIYSEKVPVLESTWWDAQTVENRCPLLGL